MLGIGYFTWWNLPQRAWYLILAELVIIIFLASSLVMEYFYNAYFRNYVDSLSPILIPLASVAFGVSSATVAARLYMGMRRVQTVQEETKVPVRRRTTGLRTRRRAVTPIVASQNSPGTGSAAALKSTPELKPDRKPGAAAPSPPKPVNQPSSARTVVPPRVQPEKETKPAADKAG